MSDNNFPWEGWIKTRPSFVELCQGRLSRDPRLRPDVLVPRWEGPDWGYPQGDLALPIDYFIENHWRTSKNPDIRLRSKEEFVAAGFAPRCPFRLARSLLHISVDRLQRVYEELYSNRERSYNLGSILSKSKICSKNIQFIIHNISLLRLGQEIYLKGGHLQDYRTANSYLQKQAYAIDRLEKIAPELSSVLADIDLLAKESRTAAQDNPKTAAKGAFAFQMLVLWFTMMNREPAVRSPGEGSQGSFFVQLTTAAFASVCSDVGTPWRLLEDPKSAVLWHSAVNAAVKDNRRLMEMGRFSSAANYLVSGATPAGDTVEISGLPRPSTKDQEDAALEIFVKSFPPLR